MIYFWWCKLLTFVPLKGLGENQSESPCFASSYVRIRFSFGIILWGWDSKIKSLFRWAPFDQVSTAPVDPSFACFGEFIITADLSHHPNYDLFDSTAVDVSDINAVSGFLAFYATNGSPSETVGDIFFVGVVSDGSGISTIWIRGFEISNFWKLLFRSEIPRGMSWPYDKRWF